MFKKLTFQNKCQQKVSNEPQWQVVSVTLNLSRCTVKVILYSLISRSMKAESSLFEKGFGYNNSLDEMLSGIAHTIHVIMNFPGPGELIWSQKP